MDGIGIQGMALHYSLTIALVGSAFLLFLLLWYKGKLQMDEGAKYQMLAEDEEIPQ